jgi:mRNA-degrading endonuclease RelE of RelBE toxin-antitoxin system
MPWDVFFHNEFEGELVELPEAIQNELLARLKLLE